MTQEASNKKQRMKKRIIIVIIAILLIVIIMLSLRACGAKSQNEDDFFDANAQTGIVPGMTREEIQSLLDQVVEEGMFNISIASTVLVKEGSNIATANIENIEANHYHMSVVITLDDTGDVVYESKGIKPGQFIENIELTKVLPVGKYNATAVFTAHDQEDYSEEGQAAAKVAILVQQ